MGTRNNLEGQVFGRLKVLSFSHLDKWLNARWNCECDCGTKKTVAGHTLKAGHAKSCGCLVKEKKVEVLAEDHQDFRVFCGMLTRCNNEKDKGYKRYGGRGIKVCKEWEEGGFWVFNRDMGDRPTMDHSIDRIDNDKGYCKENCRWATMKEQGRNRRGNKLVTYDGQTMTMSAWSEKLGINYATLKARFQKGMSIEQCLSVIPLAEPIGDDVAKEIIRLRADGLTMREVGKVAGVSVGTVFRILKQQTPGLPPLVGRQ